MIFLWKILWNLKIAGVYALSFRSRTKFELKAII